MTLTALHIAWCRLMQTSLFWDAKSVDGEFDRVYSSDDFATMFEGFWGSGVIPNTDNALMVEVIENSFSIKVNAGDAFVGGRFYQNTSDFKITLDISGKENRVDFIVLRMDKSKREVSLMALKGSEGGIEPSVSKLDYCYDLVLAKVQIPANAEYLQDENVTDCRGTSLCPWVNLRWTISNLQTQFQEWYDSIQAKFTDSVVADFNTQIETLTNSLATAETSLSAANDEIKSLNSDVASLEKHLDKANTNIESLQQYSRSIVQKDGTVYLKVVDYDSKLDTGL